MGKRLRGAAVCAGNAGCIPRDAGGLIHRVLAGHAVYMATKLMDENGLAYFGGKLLPFAPHRAWKWVFPRRAPESPNRAEPWHP